MVVLVCTWVRCLVTRFQAQVLFFELKIADIVFRHELISLSI